MDSRFRIVEAVLSAELAKPYAYGEADCFMLGCQVGDALDASLGLVERYRRAYSTLAGAQRALRRRGHASLVMLFEVHLARIAPAEAMIGDLAILQLASAEHVAICLGAGGRFVTKTPEGRSTHWLADCIAAFRVGDA